MKSISIKIKLATIFAISILVGIVLYAKADKTFLGSSDANRYSIDSDASTNLDATINAHPRASEYIASSEYTSKMAPRTTEATEYLAMHVGDDDEYKIKQAPTPGQRPSQSTSATYQDFGVRSAVTSNKSVKAVEPSEKRGSSTDFPRAVNNAVASDEAYQVNAAQTPQESSGNNYGGYAVRSAAGKDIVGGPVSDRQVAANSYGGYAVKAAKSNGNNTASGESYAGYAVKPVGGSKRAATEMTADGYGKKATPYSTHNGFFDEIQAGGRAQLAQYDNAKQGDVAYQVKSVPQSSGSYGGYAVKSVSEKGTNSKSMTSVASGESYGGYAVRSAGSGANVASKTESGYAVKSIPQASVSKNYAQTSTPARSAESEYGGYAVRSAGDQNINKAITSSPSNDSYGGYAVRSAKSPKSGTSIAQYENASSSDNAYQVKSIPQKSGDTYGGYAVRSAKGQDVNSRHVASNSSSESYGGYAVKNPGSGISTSTNSNDSYGGYAVRSIKGQSSARQSTSIAQATPRSNRLTIYDGTKVYNSRGQRVALNAPQKDRSVIVMPKRGRSIAGIVVQDDPGRSIVVQANSGAQSTFNYGEIDALVNL